MHIHLGMTMQVNWIVIGHYDATTKKHSHEHGMQVCYCGERENVAIQEANRAIKAKALMSTATSG